MSSLTYIQRIEALEDRLVLLSELLNETNKTIINMATAIKLINERINKLVQL